MIGLKKLLPNRTVLAIFLLAIIVVLVVLVYNTKASQLSSLKKSTIQSAQTLKDDSKDSKKPLESKLATDSVVNNSELPPATSVYKQYPGASAPEPVHWGDPKTVSCTDKTNALYTTYNSNLASENARHQQIVAGLSSYIPHIAGSTDPYMPSPELEAENIRHNQATAQLSSKLQADINSLNCFGS